MRDERRVVGNLAQRDGDDVVEEIERDERWDIRDARRGLSSYSLWEGAE